MKVLQRLHATGRPAPLDGVAVAADAPESDEGDDMLKRRTKGIDSTAKKKSSPWKGGRHSQKKSRDEEKGEGENLRQQVPLL